MRDKASLLERQVLPSLSCALQQVPACVTHERGAVFVCLPFLCLLVSHARCACCGVLQV